VDQDKKPAKQWQSKHFWYSVTPMLITLIVIGAINLFNPGENMAQSTPVLSTAVSAPPATPSATPTRPPILRATILPSPTPSNTPPPALPATAAITLLGPPPESSVSQNGRIVFYWHYAEPLLPGQQFVLTLKQNEAIIFAKSIEQSNLGSDFQLLLDLDELLALPGTAVWQLHLEWADTQQQLLLSEERMLVLLAK
jgi:hypothetical protein